MLYSRRYERYFLYSRLFLYAPVERKKINKKRHYNKLQMRNKTKYKYASAKGLQLIFENINSQ